MATLRVIHKVRDDGSHSIGVNIDKVFVPFVSLEGAYVDGLVANGTPEDNGDDDDDTTEKGKQ